MSLLLLLKPNGVAVIPPPPTPEAPAVVSGPKHRLPPPQLAEFPAGRARILLRAIPANVLLLPDTGTASVSFRTRQALIEAELESIPKKHSKQLTYRAIRDEPEMDEEFRRLVEAAYLLTR